MFFNSRSPKVLGLDLWVSSSDAGSSELVQTRIFSLLISFDKWSHIWAYSLLHEHIRQQTRFLGPFWVELKKLRNRIVRWLAQVLHNEWRVLSKTSSSFFDFRVAFSITGSNLLPNITATLEPFATIEPIYYFHWVLVLTKAWPYDKFRSKPWRD